MPARIPSGPPLPSRAVLMIGGLTLLCLVLVVALTFALAEAEEPALALDAPATAMPPDAMPLDAMPLDAMPLDAMPMAHPDSPAPEPSSLDDSLAPADAERIYVAEPSPIPTNVLTMLEQASDEPIEVEFNRLLDAIQHGFGESSIEIEPTLRPYAARMAGRLNVRPASFSIRVAAPDQALARARARALDRLFEAMGVVPGRLSFTPRAGVPGLSAELF